MSEMNNNKMPKAKKEKKSKKTKVVEENSTADVVDASAAKAERKRLKKEKKAALANDENKRQRNNDTDQDEIVSKKVKKDQSEGPFQQPPASSFKKAFYTQHAETSKLTKEQVVAFYEKNEMAVTGNKCEYNPIMQFDHTNFPAKVMTFCKKFKTPTPIQSQCWSILASGRDVIGIAQTGSGKTAAFCLPGMIHIMDQAPISREKPGPIMMVVAPTRELALQSNDVITEVGASCGIKSVCIYGGVPKYEQKKALRTGVQVVVGTPGRLQDLIEDGTCSMKRCTYFVLDEADRLLDDGFEKPMRAIIGAAHPQRQMAMFSATWPKAVQELAREFLSNPVKVACGSEDLVANKSVTQIVEVVEDRARDDKITRLLEKYHSSRKNRVLLFVLYKKEAVRVENMLQRRGWKCTAIHGDKMQNQRIEALEKFKNGSIPLLIATDVAARGLDIPNVEYVLNYAFPLTIEDYVHRIGRTGRGGATGISHTFFTNFDKPRAGELVNLLREGGQNIPSELLKFGTHVKKKEHKLYGAFAKQMDMTKKATKITFGSDDEDA